MKHFNIIDLKQVDSTNNYLKEKYKEIETFTIVKTNFQTKGRGQFDRTWKSLRNKNLTFSLLLKNIHFNQIILIKEWIKSSLFALLGSYGLDVYFKEPNDIYINENKICGILIETKSNENLFEYVIVGIGLNINQKVFQGFKATSISKENKKDYKIEEVFEKIKQILIESYF